MNHDDVFPPKSKSKKIMLWSRYRLDVPGFSHFITFYDYPGDLWCQSVSGCLSDWNTLKEEWETGLRTEQGREKPEEGEGEITILHGGHYNQFQGEEK